MSEEFVKILNIIITEIKVINICIRNGNNNEDECIKRKKSELRGMMICLKNINTTDLMYTLQEDENGEIGIGYFDKEGVWWKIA